MKEYPLEVLEVYDTIEKMLSPNERIFETNKQMSNCIITMLNHLYETKTDCKR